MLWVIAAIVALVVLIGFAAWFFIVEWRQPSHCQGFKTKQHIPPGSSTPVWIISWDPPSQGTGVGYNVSYSGHVTDSTGKTIHTFGPQTGTSFTLSSTVYEAIEVTVVAKNQIGTGPAYTQKLILQNQAPIVLGTSVAYKAPHTVMTITGVFPGWADGQPIPPTWKYSMKMDTIDGQSIPVTNISLARVKGTLEELQVTFDVPFVPGESTNIRFQMCRYDMCVDKSFIYIIPGQSPGESSNLHATFQP